MQVLGHRDRFDRIEQQLAAGENVVLLANHQTEADPAVSSRDAVQVGSIYCWYPYSQSAVLLPRSDPVTEGGATFADLGCGSDVGTVTQVWALLLEATHPRLATDIVYVAGTALRLRCCLRLECSHAAFSLCVFVTSVAYSIMFHTGDRVVTDPLCKPFSMGRNLFCVHSRKRLDDIPEMKAAKVQQNRRTLIAMGTKFMQARSECRPLFNRPRH